MGNQLDKDMAEALADFICCARTDWDKRGVLAALFKAKEMGDAWTVALAAITAARTASNNSPGVIPLRGPHWAATAAPERARPARQRYCGICSLAYDQCMNRPYSEHTFISVEDMKMLAIQSADTIPRERVREVMGDRRVVDVPLPHEVMVEDLPPGAEE
jgi:hypothetical protein